MNYVKKLSSSLVEIAQSRPNFLGFLEKQFLQVILEKQVARTPSPKFITRSNRSVVLLEDVRVNWTLLWLDHFFSHSNSTRIFIYYSYIRKYLYEKSAHTMGGFLLSTVGCKGPKASLSLARKDEAFDIPVLSICWAIADEASIENCSKSMSLHLTSSSSGSS